MTESATAPSNSINDQAAALILETIETVIAAQYVISPGGRSAPLAFALGQRSVAQSTVILDERQAGFYALGYARSKPHELTVLICTSGSAGAHYLPAIIEADYSGLRDTGAAQTIDQRNFFGHHVVQSAHINVDADHLTQLNQVVVDLVHTALRVQGPVHLNIGFDEPLHLKGHQTSLPACLELGADSGEQQIVPPQSIGRTLAQSHRGIIILGPNTVHGEAQTQAMLTLIETLGWVCFSHTASGLSRRGHSGIVEASIDHYLHVNSAVVRDLEVVLYFGQAPTSRILFEYLAQHPQVISLSRGRHTVRPWLHGDAYANLSTAFIEDIICQLGDMASSKGSNTHTLNPIVEQTITSESNGLLWSGPIFAQLFKMSGRRRNIIVGNSLPIRDMDRFTCSMPTNINIYANRGVNGIDGHVATACGIAAAQPEASTILICGDLTALHDIGALSLAIDVQLKVIVIDNGGGGVFNQLEFAEDSEIFERFFTTKQSTPLLEISRAHGIHVHQIDTLAAFNLDRVLNEAGASLCVLKVAAHDAQQARASTIEAINKALEYEA